MSSIDQTIISHLEGREGQSIYNLVEEVRKDYTPETIKPSSLEVELEIFNLVKSNKVKPCMFFSKEEKRQLFGVRLANV